MALAFILSPLLVVAIGALLLMLAEAFGPKHNRAAGLALGSTIVFSAGFAFSGGGTTVSPSTVHRSTAPGMTAYASASTS